MHSNGTIKVNRKGLPQEHAFKKGAALKHPRGTMEQYVTTLQNENYYFTCWMDNKPVHMLSTYRTGRGEVLRNTSVAGKYEKINVMRGDYNAGMGGTDLSDQYLSY